MARKISLSDVNQWHFSRELIAVSYLKTLFSGVLLSNTIYAPPQTGLTNFLINDLIPAALEENFLPVYVDLSDTSVPLSMSFLIGLERAVLGTPISNYSFNFFKGFFASRDKSVSKKKDFLIKRDILNPQIYEAKSYDFIELIDRHVLKIVNSKEILFIVDRVENMVLGGENIDFLNYYKYNLENKRDRVKAIYATSDMEGWNLIFKNPKSLLNSEGAFVHKLPALKRVFVRDLIDRIDKPTNLDEAVKCFEMVGYKPGVFISMLCSWQGESVSLLSEHVHKELNDLKVFEDKNKILPAAAGDINFIEKIKIN